MGLLKSATNAAKANTENFDLKNSLQQKTWEYDNLREKYEKICFELDLYKRRSWNDEPVSSSRQCLNNFGSVSSLHSNADMDVGDLIERRSSCVSLSSIKSNGSTSSRKFVPQGSGSLFTCADEEDGFQFSSKNLADVGKSRFMEVKEISQNSEDRINEIQRRNSMHPMHLRSAYAPEDLAADENQLRLTMTSNLGRSLGGSGTSLGLQRQYGTLSLSKLRDSQFVSDFICLLLSCGVEQKFE